MVKEPTKVSVDPEAEGKFSGDPDVHSRWLPDMDHGSQPIFTGTFRLAWRQGMLGVGGDAGMNEVFPDQEPGGGGWPTDPP